MTLFNRFCVTYDIRWHTQLEKALLSQALIRGIDAVFYTVANKPQDVLSDLNNFGDKALRSVLNELSDEYIGILFTNQFGMDYSVVISFVRDFYSAVNKDFISCC